MARLSRYVRLYAAYFAVSVRTSLEFRGTFIFYAFAELLGRVVWLAMLGIVLGRFKSIGGWSADRICFMVGYGYMAQSIFGILFGGVTQIGFLIRSGGLENALMRPVNPLLLLTCSNFHVSSVSSLIPGVGLIALAAWRLHVLTSIGSWIVLLVHLSGSVLLLLGLYLLLSAPAFKFEQNDPLEDIFAVLLQQVSLYPMVVFPVYVQSFLTFVLPLGFLCFYPTAAVVGGAPNMHFPEWTGMLTALIGISTFLIGYVVWMIGLRSFRTTGT